MDVEKSIGVLRGSSVQGGAYIISELDGNGKLDAIYEGTDSTDVSVRRSTSSGSSYNSSMDVIRKLVEIFLPTGYPNSVSADYLDYQIYDSIQAFSSSIASLFANRCVLSAVGVGDESATSTSALFMKIIQETVGRMGTIVFAWRFGSTLEPECKKYRYCADLVNDSATVFDCLSPLFPGSKNTKVFLLCISGLLRSICGVMAGGSRAALTQHFTDPNKGSIADVNAKDQSQETVITLFGMLTGSIVVGMVQGEGIEMWLTLFLLLSVHLWTNYQAVAHVIIRTLNRQRTNLVFCDVINSLPELERAATKDVETHLSLSKLVMSPKQTSLRERILERDGVLRWYSGLGIRGARTDELIGYGRFCGFTELVSHVPKHVNFSQLLEVTGSRGYLISFDILRTGHVIVYMVLFGGQSVVPRADVRAWVHALIIARHVQLNKASIQDGDLEVIKNTEKEVAHLFDGLQIEKSLALAGWEIDRPAIQSQPIPTVIISDHTEEADLIKH